MCKAQAKIIVVLSSRHIACSCRMLCLSLSLYSKITELLSLSIDTISMSPVSSLLQHTKIAHTLTEQQWNLSLSVLIHWSAKHPAVGGPCPALSRIQSSPSLKNSRNLSLSASKLHHRASLLSLHYLAIRLQSLHSKPKISLSLLFGSSLLFLVACLCSGHTTDFCSEIGCFVLWCFLINGGPCSQQSMQNKQLPSLLKSTPATLSLSDLRPALSLCSWQEKWLALSLLKPDSSLFSPICCLHCISESHNPSHS